MQLISIINIGGCPGIAIFSKIRACEKNYRRHMVNNGVSQARLPPRIIFSFKAEFGEKGIPGQPHSKVGDHPE